MKVIIVGGVAGGASAAARLRRMDENAQITVYEKGPYISYANCGLPYYIGGDITDKYDLLLETPDTFKQRFNIDVFVNHKVVAINKEKKQVTVEDLTTGKQLIDTYDKLVLSPGAEVIVPPLPGIDSPLIFTLRTVPDTLKIKDFIANNKPQSVLIVGGGYIGIEMAENLTQAGLRVTVAELTDHVIAPLDYDMASEVHQYLRHKGVTLLLNQGVQSFATVASKITATVAGKPYEFDMVLMSVGVKPDTKFVVSSGLKLSSRGAILTDEHMLTSDSNIYAVGDAVAVKNYVTGEEGYIPLAGPANKQGRIVADNLVGIPSTYKGTQGAAILKVFDMNIATTGLNETAIKKAGIAYDKIYNFDANQAGYYPGGTNMTIKLLFEKVTGKILGAQIVGFKGVDKRIDVLSVAMRGHLSVDDLTDLEIAYAPPFAAAKDPINMTGYLAQNVLHGVIKQYYVEDLCQIPSDGSVTFLDVRSPGEFRRGHIEGAINIPVDFLRENLHKLDKGKKIYVNCQSGFRSYLACRILSQLGYDCAHLAGGYRLFQILDNEAVVETGLKGRCGRLLKK
ncbi:MAG: CoA-disulfide reductase [Firmicutes bacterium]|nr:CoA-disulfide reductase [Bacillota bacterium]